MSAPIVERFGRCAVVTGASDGIGRATAIELAKAGFDLVLVARRLVALDQLASELRSRYGVRCTTLSIDLAQPQAATHLLNATADHDVGLLVAAAGYGRAGPFVASDVDEELGMVDVNCRAVVGMTHGFARRFCERNRGAIVLFSSLVGWQGAPYSAVYAASKAFVQSFAEALGHELATTPVKVLACAPGPVATGFAHRAGMVMGKTDSAEAIAHAIVGSLGRTGTLVPGFLGKLLTYALSTLPRWLRVRIMAGIMHGMWSNGTRVTSIEGHGVTRLSS